MMLFLMLIRPIRKLAAAGDKDPKMVKEAVFGEQFHTICSGGAYLQPELLDLFAKYDIAILQGYGMFPGDQHDVELEYPKRFCRTAPS